MNNLSCNDIQAQIVSVENLAKTLKWESVQDAKKLLAVADSLRELLALREAGKGPVYQYQIDGAWQDCDYEFYSGCHETYRRVTYAAPQLPAVPDGWVMVPQEPTEDMVINGFESDPDAGPCDDADAQEAYEAMSGCQQAAHRAKLCWAAMIAAAPTYK